MPADFSKVMFSETEKAFAATIPPEYACVYAAKLKEGQYCLFLIDKNSAGMNADFKANLIVLIGNNGNFRQQSIRAGVKLPGHWYVLTENNIYFCYHRKTDGTDEFSFSYDSGCKPMEKIMFPLT